MAISSLFSAYHPDVELLVAQLKAQTSAKVAVGGWAVRAQLEELSRHSSADYLIVGDESEFVNFVTTFKSGAIKGHIPIVWSKSSHITSCGQKGEVSFDSIPSRQGSYKFRGRPIASMTISRGCPYRCEFCSIHSNLPYRRRSIDSIVKELEYLTQIGIKTVNFEDDNIFDRNQRLEALLDVLTHFHHLGINYMAMNGITANGLVSCLGQAIGAGFSQFNLSLVSSDSNITKRLHRPVNLNHIKNIAYGSVGLVEVLVYVICGLPQQTPKMVLADILGLAHLPVRIGISPLYLVPGVALFNSVERPKDQRLMRGSALYPFAESFTRQDVISLWKFVKMLNILKENKQTEEDFYYFQRSLREGVWYRKVSAGGWSKWGRCTLSLPAKVDVADLKGRVHALLL